MKNHNILTFGACVLALSGLWSCQADMDTPEMEVPSATIQANTSIRDLKTQFRNKTELVGTREDGSHYIIHGRVVSSDASGNIYKNLVIQDETAALTFSVNQGSMYCDWRLGQDVVVDMTGLYMGYYRGLQQVGSPGDPYDGAPQLGFMAYDYWLGHAQKEGLPDPTVRKVTADEAWPADNMYCVELTLPISQSDLVGLQSQLVEIRNVHFVGAGELPYSNYHETVSRYLKNADGDSIAVRMSGYSNFYNQTLPEGTGRVRGILGYYGDSWQLTPRDNSDIEISSKGMVNDPYTVTEALEASCQGDEGWIKGYIVGSVRAGVSTVTGNGDAIFGPDAELDNNILLAADPECTDVSQCLAVELPQSTVLRRYANLADNPGVYRKEMTIEGVIGKYLGMTGLADNKGSAGTFTIEGVEIRVPTGDFKEVYHGLLTTDTRTDFTFDNVTLGTGLSYVWSWKNYNGYYLNGSGYAGGQPHEALSYAVSPEIDLSTMLEAKLSFRHAAKFQTTLRELCGVCVREAGSATWTELTVPVWPEAGAWKFVGSGDIDISAFAGKKVQVAFKYGSSTAGADTWEVNDLVVSAR